MSDWSDANGEIRFRTWRRWEMESYLMGIPAMKRIYKRNNPGLTDEEVDTKFNTELTAVSVVVNDDYLQSDKTPSNQSLFLNDAKDMLHPLLRNLGMDKWDVIAEMTEVEIFEDVKTMVNEIVDFCR